MRMLTLIFRYGLLRKLVLSIAARTISITVVNYSP